MTLKLAKGFSRAVVYEKSALFVASDGFMHKKRQISNYEIIYVINGKLYFQEGSRQYCISEGDVFIASPNVTHFGYYPSEVGTSFFWAHFFLTSKNAVTFDSPLFHIGNNIQLLELFKHLIHSSNSPVFNLEALNQNISLILSEISVSTKAGNIGEPYCSAIKWIDEYIPEKQITARDVVSRFSDHETDFTSGFKKSMNVSLSRYLTEKRLDAAKRYLLNTSLYIKEIAAKLGFSDTDKFVKFFKYHEHITPGEFRNGYYNTLIHNV